MSDANSIADHELESRVTATLESILEKYVRIDLLADDMLAAESLIGTFDEHMLELRNERDAIEQLQSENRLINERYRATRPHASANVKQLTEKIGSLMQGLLMKITKLERQAKGSCQQLLPQIHEGVRAIQMKNAYGKYT